MIDALPWCFCKCFVSTLGTLLPVLLAPRAKVTACGAAALLFCVGGREVAIPSKLVLLQPLPDSVSVGSGSINP